jgi:zinc/manganese transport system substrate-binding protein
MRKTLCHLLASLALFGLCGAHAQAAKLKVVTTLPDYATFAQAIGGERVSVSYIVRGDQDAHFVRPKPSFAQMVRQADVLIDTGLDLETWLPTVVDTSGNRQVRSGQPGYVSASYGMRLLEKPKQLSRSEGGLHIYGNPHVTGSPVLMKAAARNIASGLIKNDPEGKQLYLRNLEKLEDELDRRLFGEQLVKILGGDTLCSLAEKGKLVPFLRSQRHQGKPMIGLLGGWTRKMLPLYGAEIVTYHKNWVYFFKLFGLEEAGTVEPKPGIPPSARHVAELVKLMRERKIRILLAANYFPQHEVRDIAEKVNAEPVVVPLYVGGAAGIKDYFDLIDHYVNSLVLAGERAGLVKG